MAGGAMFDTSGMQMNPFQIGYGLLQAKEANKYASWQRPDYEIPESVKQYLGLMKGRAGMDMPGMARMEAKIGESSAGANRGIMESQQSPSAMLAGLVGTDATTKSTIADVGINNAQFRDNATVGYGGALKDYGNWEFNQWQWNKQMPYLSAMQAAKDLKSASDRNRFGTDTQGPVYHPENNPTGNGSGNRPSVEQQYGHGGGQDYNYTTGAQEGPYQQFSGSNPANSDWGDSGGGFDNTGRMAQPNNYNNDPVGSDYYAMKRQYPHLSDEQVATIVAHKHGINYQQAA